jgi:hypothetical protein
MVRVPYHLALRWSAIKRKQYLAALPTVIQRGVQAKPAVPITVYTMSCERDLPEQVACIYSFLRNVGEPKQFVVVSDGSYSASSVALLEKISPAVKVIPLSAVLRDDLPDCIRAYSKVKPLGKKLAILWSIPIEGTTMYTDADILFFRQAAELVTISRNEDQDPWYLPDMPGALDERMLESDTEKINPINSGFIVLKRRLDWDLSLHRLARIGSGYDYFSEQTTLHLTLHNSKAKALDPQQFVVQNDDAFNFRDCYAGHDIALRHYVTGVRHKFWQANWE